MFLIEVAGVEMGAELSAPVTAAMEQVIDMIDREYLAPLRPDVDHEVTVEFTADGYLRLTPRPRPLAFLDAVAAVLRDDEFWLIPLRGPRSGGLLLKQRTPAGDRCVLVSEVLRNAPLQGVFRGCWDDEHTALRIPVAQSRERNG